MYVKFFYKYFIHEFGLAYGCSAAAIPKAKGGACLQMKLVYNNWAPVFLFLLQWLDCSCTCLLPRYLNFFHILVYKVSFDVHLKELTFVVCLT